VPRPKRKGWNKITITVSDKVAREIRVRSAELGIEMGTFVDQTIRDHEMIPPFLDKLFANDCLKAVRKHANHAELVGEMTGALIKSHTQLNKPLTSSALTRMAVGWAKGGLVPKPWKWAGYFALFQGDWEPTGTRSGLLKGYDWVKH